MAAPRDEAAPASAIRSGSPPPASVCSAHPATRAAIALAVSAVMPALRSYSAARVHSLQRASRFSTSAFASAGGRSAKRSLRSRSILDHASVHRGPPIPGSETSARMSRPAARRPIGGRGSISRFSSARASNGAKAQAKASGSTCSAPRNGEGAERPSAGSPRACNTRSSRAESPSGQTTTVPASSSSDPAASHSASASAAISVVSASSCATLPSPRKDSDADPATKRCSAARSDSFAARASVLAAATITPQSFSVAIRRFQAGGNRNSGSTRSTDLSDNRGRPARASITALTRSAKPAGGGSRSTSASVSGRGAPTALPLQPASRNASRCARSARAVAQGSRANDPAKNRVGSPASAARNRAA